MNNLILYSDASEKFKYKLTLEGAKIEETKTRMCLEFNTGENLYFKGKIDQSGNCIVNINALKNFEGTGKAKIEVIAEKTYFLIHEMDFEIKKKVNVTFDETTNEGAELEVEENIPHVSISFERVVEKEEVKEKPVIKPVIKQKVNKSIITEADAVIEQEETEIDDKKEYIPLMSFTEFLKNKR